MGKTFYEYTLPELIKSINRLAESLNKLVMVKKSLLFKIVEEEVARVCPDVDMEKLLSNIDKQLSSFLGCLSVC